MTKLHYALSAWMLLVARAALAQAPVAAAAAAPQAGGAQHTQHANGEVSIARRTLPCEHIITECKKLGYVVGQYKKDNGLWIDCFNPVIKGGRPTRDGAPVTVPVNPGDVQACRAAVFPNTAATP